ncbi:MAG: cyclic pyranopterin monophosphate synthase MoaC [Verrucomicrobiales bacterium]
MDEGRKLTHVDEEGKASMVDVSAKAVVAREALAQGRIRLCPAALEAIRENSNAKGDVLAVARIAGIQAAKETSNLIPLCHQLPLSHVEVDFEQESEGIRISCRARTRAQTGVEMEALTGVSVAALTIYDMCKAIDKGMVILDISLLEKRKDEAGA